MIAYIKNTFFNLPLRWKFFIFTILISIIPVTFIGLFSYNYSQEYLKQSAINSAIMKSDTVNSKIERYLSNIDDTSLMLISNYYLQNYLKEDDISRRYIYENEMRKLFSTILLTKNDIHSIVLYDSKGNYKVYVANLYDDGSFKNSITENIESNQIFDNVYRLAGKRIWTKLYKNTDKISMIRVVNEIGSQNQIGTLVINLNESNLHQVIKESDLMNEGSFFVFEQGGDIIYSSGVKTFIPKVGQVSDNISSYKVTRVNNEDYLDVRYISNFCDWKMVSLVPLKTLFLKVSAIKDITVSLIIICLIIVIASSIFLTYFLTKPIMKLSRLMRKVEDGDLGIRFENSYNDEIGRLGQNFNSMLEKAKILMDENVEKQKRLRIQELKALQAQINPHFLYNTIDTINWLAQSIDADDISEISIALANYYRLSLSKGADIIKISDEINQVKNYLTIQKIRYNDYLNYEFNISETILNLNIIKLTLQPLVENAIYHGIKDKLGYGMIHIIGRREDDKVIFEICDNGKGMDAEKLENIRASLEKVRVEGFGLSNVNERIKLNFGEEYGIAIDSIENIFTKVTITIPIVE